MQPAYYENLEEIQNKYWSMLEDAVTNRGSPFRIPVFICAHQDEVDGRIIVLRKSDREKNLLQFHTDLRSPKVDIIKKNKISNIDNLKTVMSQTYYNVKREKVDYFNSQLIKVLNKKNIKFYEQQNLQLDITKAKKIINDAANKGANIILLQELFQTPYFCIEYDEEIFRLAKPFDDKKENLFQIENISGVKVLVKKAKGKKCPRCWKITNNKCDKNMCAM